ncbi:hypothetical protein L226DRAFT_539572 [Lentinus tigrinus ALCF2SS1-7]|uniref:uncharacterized protein n=1 Tax=Lentinus tigrinus ALCF2SS1-7 TaxID=1328758 RepID=UPI001166027F|nr:hypothetical protein L226DRAFT_539572 [Lentinus tigrinus ALCF2SS1-7]
MQRPSSSVPTPTARPRPARQPEGQRSQQAAASARPLCWADEHLMSILPGYKPMGQDELDDVLESMGGTPQNRDKALEAYNKLAKDLVNKTGVRVIGMKPKPGDPIYTVDIPNSPLVFRIWEGGMGPYSQFCVDFYDAQRKVSVNLPQGHSLHPASIPVPAGGYGFGFGYGYAPMPGSGYPYPGMPMPTPMPMPMPMNVNPPSSSTAVPRGQLGSWERNMGMDANSIPEGEEKWMIPEGQHITLRREGHPHFTFQMPTRQPAFVVAQPRLAVA